MKRNQGTLIQKIICPVETIKYYKGNMIATCMEEYNLSLFQACFVVEELPDFELLRMVDSHASENGTYFYKGVQYESGELEAVLKKDYKLIEMRVVSFEIGNEITECEIYNSDAPEETMKNPWNGRQTI